MQRGNCKPFVKSRSIRRQPSRPFLHTWAIFHNYPTSIVVYDACSGSSLPAGILAFPPIRTLYRVFIKLPAAAHIINYKKGSDNMSYVNPKIKTQFESLSIALKNEILSRDVRLENLYDLIHVLDEIVKEEESAT